MRHINNRFTPEEAYVEVDNYYESINALAARQPEQLFMRRRSVIAISSAGWRSRPCRRVRLPLSCSQGQALPVKPPRRAKSPRPRRERPWAYTVSLDNFYLNQDLSPRLPDGTPDFETVHALDIPLIHETFCRLMQDGRCELPLFDFPSGRRLIQTERLKLEKGDVVIVEGLHA